MKARGRGPSTPPLIKTPIEARPGVSFTLEQVKPHLRGELNRRIMAIAEVSADLIGSDRDAVIEATLKRFAGWITPTTNDAARGPMMLSRIWTWVISRFIGGSKLGTHMGDNIKLPTELSDVSFEERWRLVMLEQGFMFSASLSEMLAIDGGAIGAIWRWQSYPEEYQSLEEHRQRDGNVYALCGCWAIKRGLMKQGPAGYYCEVASVGHEPGCRCYVTWVYSPRDLPKNMLTPKGRVELKRVRTKTERQTEDTNRTLD